MSDTYEAFYNGKPLNPNRGLPTMSYAQAEDCGLTDSERLWCRTDGDGTVITADEVPYDSNNSVKDMLEISSITISERNNNVNVSNAFRIGKLVVLDFYNGSGEISANDVWFRVDESARPSSAKATMNWLPTDSSNFGSKTFTMDTDGRIKCNANVFRGGAKLIYYI